MFQIFKIVALLIPLTISSLAYTGPSKIIDPQPVPPELIAVEDALAGPDLIGLFYFDIDYALRLEKVFLGEGDSLALPTSTGKKTKEDDSFFGFLKRSGLKPGESVDTIIGGFLNKIKKGGQVQVALGNFPVETVTQKWRKNKNIKQTQVNGRTAWLWSGVDKETCKPSSPALMVVENHRLIIGDPEAVASLLKRLDQPKAEKDLGKWRDYRKGKLFAFAVLVPKDLEKVSQNGMARMFAHSAKKQMAPVTGVYGGGTITWKPKGIDLEVLFETANAEWNQEQRQNFLDWKNKTAGKVDPAFKSIKGLLNHLDLQTTDEKIKLQAKINDTLIKNIKNVFQEGVDWFASSLSSSMSISMGASDKKTPSEKTIPHKEVNQYQNVPRPKDLDPFDATADPNKIFATTAGPFGIQVKGISLNTKEAGGVDLDLEIVSSPIPKIEVNAFAEEGEGTGAWFRVTHVLSKSGKELLKEEPCGKDRNSKAVTLQKGFRSVEVKRVSKTPTIKKLIKDTPRWSNLTLDVLQGSKTVHLKPGTRLSDIASIEGKVQLQLPTDIVKKRVRMPFKNKIVQTASVRIKLKEAKDNSVSFTTSGEVGRLLDTRALNSSGKYLQSSGSSSSSLFIGNGVNKNQNFRGKPKTIEFVFARTTSKKTYPFQFKFQRPNYPANQFYRSVAVKTQSKRSFLSKRVSTPKHEVCSNGFVEFQSRPFYICLNPILYIQSKLQQPGKYASGYFIIHTQDTAAITNNLSALQLTVEKVIAKDGSNPIKKTLLLKDEQFFNIYGSYSPPLKGDRIHIAAGPVKEEEEGLTLIGFEGYLKVRLPRKLDSFRLDLFTLGSTSQSSNGLKAKFIGITEKGVHMEIGGPRKTLVHFTPLNLRGKPLTQKDPRIKKLNSEGKTIWQAEVQVPPETRYMDIVFAPQQDTWKIPFHLEK